MRQLGVETFFFALGALLLEKSVMFHARELRLANAAVLFFTSAIKPLRWNFPVVPLIVPKNYDLMRSPFPILGCIQDDLVFVMNTWNSQVEPNLVHVDLDNNYSTGSLKVKLEKLFKGFKAFHKVKENYERIQKLLFKQSFVDFDDPDNLYVVETLNLIRNLLNEVYFFDDKLVRTHPQPKEYILARSKLDKTAHLQLLNTQLFASYYAK